MWDHRPIILVYNELIIRIHFTLKLQLFIHFTLNFTSADENITWARISYDCFIF
jgi:hypothetical protein